MASSTSERAGGRGSAPEQVGAASQAGITLLHRVEVQVGDGPRAFIERLAEANRLPVRFLVERGVEWQPDTLRSLRCAPPIGVDTGLDQYLESVSRGRRDCPEGWIWRRWRYCVDCVREGKRWALAWEVRFIDACVAHRKWLVDTCGHCGRATTLEHLMQLRCDCG